MAPQLEIFAHSETFDSDDLTRLENLANQALPMVLSQPGAIEEALVLPELEAVEISLISDPQIADVHGQFMDDPTATDVITFQHGEILISTDTAARVANELGQPALREACLYLIHGLLHLNGYDDLSDEPRKIMHLRQEEILRAVWPLLDPAAS